MANRGQRATRRRRGQQRRRTGRRPTTLMRSRRMQMSGQSRTPSSLGFQHVRRVLTAALPILSGSTQLTLLSIFDLAFNLYKLTVDSKVYYPGAYCMYKITPGCLVKQSPLLAQNGAQYSFPGHPISLKYIACVIHSTVALSSYVGKWAAVFIPFIEPHDDKHYAKYIDKLTFDEIATMPNSVTGPSYTDLRLMYRMRDRTAYCARPRELDEAIGLVIVAWDNQARDTPADKPLNSQFNCEFELTAGFQPHVIFGPQHRVNYEAGTFKPITLTDGTKAMDVTKRKIEDIDWSHELLAQMEIH